MHHLNMQVGFVAALVFTLLSCSRQEGLGQKPVHKSDPLLGTWVMVANNAGPGPRTTVDFRADGSAVFTVKGKKPEVVRYRREAGAKWVARRTHGMPTEKLDGALDEFKKPGVEMVYFAGPDGKFLDYGGSLLTLDPERRILYNILTQMWCRPGDEARVKKLYH